MPPTDVEREPVPIFVLDHAYVFKRYFELNELFDALADFYDPDEYRFVVPEDEWEGVASVLREYHYEPEVVDDVAGFVVVKEQYTAHAEILKRSVANWTRRGYNFFLMKDRLSVERAVEEYGATSVTETDLVVGL